MSLWAVREEALGCLRCWEDEASAVFYSVRSGDTHLVDSLALEVHDLLMARPMTESELLDALSDVIEPGRDAEAAQELRGYLLRLQEFGLLRESIA